MNKQFNTQFIKQTAHKLGFDFCGISQASFLDEEAPKLDAWLAKKQHGEMTYMENYHEMRLDPRKLLSGAKSVISLSYNYFQKNTQPVDSPKISKYAYGEDYHDVIKKKLGQFIELLQQHIGEITYKICVDSAPVLEKAWARKSGLGWIGKNSNLITKTQGSFFFLSEIILDVELEYDHAIKDYCGTCTRCIDSCPTSAIIEPYIVDGSKCISYFTIELKNEIDQSMKGKFDDWMFGCDVCQDVCPWNRFSRTTNEEGFKPIEAISKFTREEWKHLSEEKFKVLFKHSPIKRSKYKGIMRNLKFLGNTII